MLRIITGILGAIIVIGGGVLVAKKLKDKTGEENKEEPTKNPPPYTREG